jgi:acyl-coenzyme A thioesterase PaaI-like protein
MHCDRAVVPLVVERHHAELQLARGGELVAELDHVMACVVAQALFFERCADPRTQHCRVHRFGQVVLRAELDATHDAFVFRGGRHHDHRE